MANDTALTELAEYVDAALPGAVQATEWSCGQLTLVCGLEDLARLLSFLRDDANSLFKILIDIAGVDWPERPERFDVAYNLLSLTHNQRVRVKVQVSDEELVPSITGIYKAAGWYEREAWDLFGILFTGNPDLRRILTDYGFEGHPMRKDFPLTGHVEVRYDEQEKRVVYEPVKLTQEFRTFDFMSPWEGAEYILPGDEKAPDAADGGAKD